MNLQSKFGYFIISQNLNIAFCKRAELRTYKRTDEQTDDPITRCPRRTFQAGGIKMVMLQNKIQASKFLHRADSLSLTKDQKQKTKEKCGTQRGNRDGLAWKKVLQSHIHGTKTLTLSWMHVKSMPDGGQRKKTSKLTLFLSGSSRSPTF